MSPITARCTELVTPRPRDAMGGLDILVNNAAFQMYTKGLEDLQARGDRADVPRQHPRDVSPGRAALPHMAPGSTIINTASIRRISPSPDMLDYASTKGAIVEFTKSLAQRSSTRHPRQCRRSGPVWTPLIPQSSPGEGQGFGTTSPIGRPAQPAELAPAYVFLACEESRYVTGDILGVTGGMLLA